MRTFWTILTAFLLAASAQADTRIKATVIFTNIPVTGDTFALNGNSRIWTNASTFPNTFIKTDTTVGGSATNAYNAFAQTGFAGSVVVSFIASNQITFLGALNQSMTVALSTAYASISYSTNFATNQTPVLVPVSAYQSSIAQTNVPTQLVTGVNTYAQNTFTLSRLPHDFATDIFSNGVVFNALLTNVTSTNGAFYNPTFSNSVTTNAIVSAETNFNGVFSSPTTTNLVNYGSALSSRGAASGEQFGNGATAGGSFATSVGKTSIASGSTSAAFGYLAAASGGASTAIGTLTTASGTSDTAIGNSAGATGTNSTALGTGSQANGLASTAIGKNSFSAGFTNSVALGANSQNTANNQVMLASAGVNVVVNNDLNVTGNLNVTGVLTNTTYAGTNNNLGDYSFRKATNSALAIGLNADVDLKGATFVSITNIASGFTVVGFAGGRDGRIVIVQNATGQNMSILDQSGLESVPANRIMTGITGSILLTNIPSFLQLIYDPSQQRWQIINHSN